MRFVKGPKKLVYLQLSILDLILVHFFPLILSLIYERLMKAQISVDFLIFQGRGEQSVPPLITPHATREHSDLEHHVEACSVW